MTERSSFAQLAEPPHGTVSCSAQRNPGDEAGCAVAAQRILELAARPGFLGAEGACGAEGFGITAAITAWKHQAKRAATRTHGRERWSARSALRVGRGGRACSKPSCA